MNDLISRQALCEYALNQKDKSVTPNDIMRFPSAEPKTSKWVDDGDPLMLTCGNCGYVVMRYNNTPFCPHCGSYNRGEHNG